MYSCPKEVKSQVNQFENFSSTEDVLNCSSFGLNRSTNISKHYYCSKSHRAKSKWSSFPFGALFVFLFVTILSDLYSTTAFIVTNFGQQPILCWNQECKIIELNQLSCKSGQKANFCHFFGDQRYPKRPIKQLFTLLPVTNAVSCFTSHFMFPKSVGLITQSQPSLITAIDSTSTAIYVGGYLGDTSYLPDSVTATNSTFPFVGAVDSTTNKWLWRIVNPNNSFKTEVQALVYNSSTSRLVVVISDRNSNWWLLELNALNGLQTSPSAIQIANLLPGQGQIACMPGNNLIRAFAISTSNRAVLFELNLSQSVAGKTIFAPYDSANTFFNSKYVVTGTNFISGQTGYFNNSTTLKKALIKITIYDHTNNPIVSLVMISPNFSDEVSQNLATTPVLTHLKSVGAIDILGAMTFLSDNGNNMSPLLFRINVTGTSVISSKVKGVLNFCKVVDIADSAGKTAVLISRWTGLTNENMIAVYDWNASTNDCSFTIFMQNDSVLNLVQTGKLYSATLAYLSRDSIASPQVSQLFSSQVANSNTCAGMVNQTGIESSAIATVPEFVKVDSSIILSPSEVTSNAITDGVIAVSDVYLQWLPQNETLLKDQACTSGATYTVTPVNNSPGQLDYNLSLRGIQMFSLNIGTITSASCSDQLTAISYFISSLIPNVSELTQISVLQGVTPQLAVQSTAVTDGPSVVTIGMSLPNGQSFPMQTVNLNFCKILDSPVIFENVSRTVGDPNTTSSIMPTIPALYSLCKFSVSLTVTKDGNNYNPHTIISFVDQANINSSSTTLLITWNTLTTTTVDAGVYVVSIKYTLPDGSFVNSTFNFTLSCRLLDLDVNNSLSDDQELLGKPNVTLLFPPSRVETGCTFNVSVSAIKTMIIPPATDTSSSVFSVVPMINLTSSQLDQVQLTVLTLALVPELIGVYQFTITYSWGSNGQINAVRSFQFTVKNPCPFKVKPPVPELLYTRTLNVVPKTVDVSPKISNGYEFCKVSMTMSSSINTFTQIQDALGTIGFSPLVDAVQPALDNVSLNILPSGVPYNMMMGGTYNVTVDYDIEGIIKQSAFLINVIDPCETEVVLPAQVNLGINIAQITITSNFTDSPYSFNIAPLIPPAYSWCTFNFRTSGFNEQVPGQAYKYFQWQNREPGTYSDLANMEFKVHNNTYNQKMTGSQLYDFQYEVGNSKKAQYIQFNIKDPCISIFQPKNVISEIAFIGDPDYVKYIAKNVFNAPSVYPQCLAWTKITITKLGGGTTNSNLFDFAELNGASIAVAEANTMTVKFSSASVADCGDYEVSILFQMIPDDLKTSSAYATQRYFHNISFLVTILPNSNDDKCIVFTKIPPSKNITWYVGLDDVTNGILFIYPLTNYLHLECSYSFQAQMQKDGGPFNSVSSYSGFVQTDQLNANYANSMDGFVKGNFTTYDKTLQGLYHIHVNYQWANATQNGFQDFYVTLEDHCPIKMTPSKIETKQEKMKLGRMGYWDHWERRPNNYYEFCSVILTWTITKTPQTYDTRSELMPWTTAPKTKTGRGGEFYYYNVTYNWQKSGNYTISQDIAYQSPGLYNKVLDHLAHVNYQYKVEVIDPCGDDSLIPQFAAQTAYIGNPTPVILNLAPSYTNEICQASVAINITKDNLPFNDTENFNFTPLGFSTQAQLASAIITIKTPYQQSLLGSYIIQVTYQVTQFDFKSLNITLTILDACKTGFTPLKTISNQVLSTPAVLEINIQPTIDPLYSWCIYSINLITTKTTTPDTSANVVLFANMVDKAQVDLVNAVITLSNLPYNTTDVGVYNLQVTYSWSFPVLTQVVNFTLTITDLCTTQITASSILPTYQLYLGDPNSVINLSLSYTVGYDYCTVSVAILVSKDTSPDTTSTLFTFSDVTNQAVSNLTTYNVQVLTSIYDLTLKGRYTFTVTYSWGGPTQIVKTAIVLVGDACISKTSTLSPVNQTKTLTLANSTMNVAPLIATSYTMCIYSIVMTVTKNTTPNTSATAIRFDDMLGATYAQMGNAVITFQTIAYDLSLVGVYTVTLNYSWNGPTTVTRTFTVTFLDPCVAAIVPPTPGNVTKTLSDPNSTVNVAPTINSSYQMCIYSIIMTVTKNSAPNTSSSVIIFTNMVNASYTQLTTAILTIQSSSLDLNLLGIYTITLAYSWNGPSTANKVFTVSLLDPCITMTVPPTTIMNVTRNLSDANFPVNVGPAITGTNAQICSFSISMTVKKNNVLDTSMTTILFTNMVNSPYSSLSLAVVTIATSIYNASLAGIYTVTLNYDWPGPSFRSVTFTATVIDPCISATTAPDSIQNVSTNLTDANVILNVSPIITGIYNTFCSFSIAITVSKIASLDTSFSAILFTNMVNAPYSQLGNAILTIATSGYNPSIAGVYTVSCSYTWNGPSTALKSFTVTIVDPCIQATVPPTMPATTRYLSDPTISVNVAPAITGPYSSSCFFSIAMTVSKSTNPDTSAAMIQFTNMIDAPFTLLSSAVVTISTGSYIPQNAGVYTVTLVFSWNGPTSATQVFTVTIIDACIAATIPPASIQNVTRNLSDPNLSVNVSPAISGPYASTCFFSISMTVTKSNSPDTSSDVILFTEKINASFSQLSSSVLTIKTPYVPNLVGFYTVNLIYAWAASSTATKSFFVTVIDPCITLVTPPSFANISRSLSKFYQFENVAPIITGPYAPNCVFSIRITKTKNSIPDTSSSIFVWTDMIDAPFSDLNKGILKLKIDTYDPNFAGVYDFQIDYGWAGSQTDTRTLQITILDPCLSELTPPPAIAGQLIKYGDNNSALDISVSITSVDYDFCRYSVSLSSIQPEIVQFNQILNASMADQPHAIINFVTDVSFLNPTVRGKSKIIVDYSWGLVSTFQLLIDLEVVNQCDSTLMRNQLILDMKYQVGEKAILQEISQFQDSFGEKKGIESCGLRTYTLTPDEPIVTFVAPISVTQNPKIILKTEDKFKVRNYIFNLKVCLASYPAIPCVNQEFNVSVMAQKLNQLPYFKPKLPLSLRFEILQPDSIIKSWYYTLPSVFDDDNDPVKVIANFGALDSFIELIQNTIFINEIRENKTNMKPGFYPLFFTLDDGKNQTQFNVPLFIDPLSSMNENIFFNISSINSTNTTVDEQARLDNDSYSEWIKYLKDLEINGKISPLEKLLLSQADLATLQNGNMKELQQTNNFTNFLVNFASGNYTRNLTDQEFMNLLMSDLNDLRTGYAVSLENNMRNPPVILDKKPPKPYVISVSDTGRLVIGFTSDVFKVPDIRMINNGTIYLSDLQKMGNSRLLEKFDWDRKADQFPVLSFSIIPGDGQNVKDLSFTWIVTDQTNSQLDIQFNFENPWAVSSGYSPDKMLIKFNDPMLFLGKNGFLIDRDTRVIEKIIKRQSYSTPVQKIMEKTFTSTKVAGKVALVSNFLANIFVSGALNQVFTMINVQQLIVQLPLFAIQMPASGVQFFASLMSIASFDFIDLEAMINKYFGMLPTGPYNQKFEDLGFRSTLFLNNLGTFAVVFLLYFTALFFLLCLRFCKKNQRVERLRITLREKLVFNFLISMLFESYSQIVICCFINFKTIAWSTMGVIIQTSFAIIFCCGCIIIPFWIILKLTKKFDQLQSFKYRIMFGDFYEELDLERGKKVFLQPIFFLLRRIQFAAMVLFVTTFTWQFIFLILHLVSAIVLQILLKPFSEKKKEIAEMMNEVLLLIMFYHVMCFTSFVTDLGGQQYMGYSMIALVGLSIVYNIAMIAFDFVQKGIRDFKIYMMLRKLKKQIKDRKLKIKDVLKNMKNIRKIESNDLERGEPNSSQEEQKQQRRPHMDRLQKKNRKMKAKLTQLAVIQEENEESNRSNRQSRSKKQEWRKLDESKESKVSEEEKQVISSEELEKIEQAIAESLEEASPTGFNSSIVSMIDHKPTYLVQKPTADQKVLNSQLNDNKKSGFHASIVSIIDHKPNYLVQKTTADQKDYIFQMKETQGPLKQAFKHQNFKHERYKSQVIPQDKPTLDDLVAEMNTQQREDNERVKHSFGPEETTHEQMLIHARFCQQVPKTVKYVQTISQIKTYPSNQESSLFGTDEIKIIGNEKTTKSKKNKFRSPKKPTYDDPAALQQSQTPDNEDWNPKKDQQSRENSWDRSNKIVNSNQAPRQKNGDSGSKFLVKVVKASQDNIKQPSPNQTRGDNIDTDQEAIEEDQKNIRTKRMLIFNENFVRQRKYSPKNTDWNHIDDELAIAKSAAKKQNGFELHHEQREQKQDQSSQMRARPPSNSKHQPSQVKTQNFVVEKDFETKKQKTMKTLMQALAQPAQAKNISKEDYQVSKFTTPILSQLEDIVASQQQSKREQDACWDAIWGDESKVIKHIKNDLENSDPCKIRQQMNNINQGSNCAQKEFKPLVNNKKDQDVVKTNKLESLDSIVASMQVSERKVEDPANSNWNFDDLKPKQEQSRVGKRVNLEYPYFEKMKTSGHSQQANFATKESRPLQLTNQTNAFKERISDLDDLIDTNEEIKKDQDFENLEQRIKTRVNQAFRADPVQATQAEISKMIHKRVMEAFKGDLVKSPRVPNQSNPLKIEDEGALKYLQEAAALKIKEVFRGPTKLHKDAREAWEQK